MSKVDDLLTQYRKTVDLPWKQRLAGAQKVWFVVYEPSYEREMRARIGEFKLATNQAGHAWKRVDVTASFPTWMAEHPYRDAYFEDPSDLEWSLEDFTREVASSIQAVLQETDEQTVVAVTGIGTLFGLTYVSEILDAVNDEIDGRLAVFFPGRHHNNTYRLLDARDGWDYLAMPIKPEPS